MNSPAQFDLPTGPPPATSCIHFTHHGAVGSLSTAGQRALLTNRYRKIRPCLITATISRSHHQGVKGEHLPGQPSGWGIFPRDISLARDCYFQSVHSTQITSI